MTWGIGRILARDKSDGELESHVPRNNVLAEEAMPNREQKMTALIEIDESTCVEPCAGTGIDPISAMVIELPA
jgi:hypothetical protein